MLLKLGRFFGGGRVFYGVVEDSGIYEVSDPFTGPVTPGSPVKEEGVRTLAPCVPGKAVCVGLNYRSHALEMGLDLPGEPILFIKPAGTVIGPGDFIEYPEMSGRVDYEAELALVIGTRCKNAPVREALRYVLGVTCANDVTARDLQQRDGQWTRAKSFDTFLPLGPYIITGLEPDRLDISLYLNGELKQRSNTADLIFNAGELVSFISRVMTLNPGDVILTGTPSGIGPMERGDRVEVVIGSVGTLSNMIR
jgi:2-keto-4-pentenoate hydratase/2-oxohepta-3-ene-1,7-dioic acid hydratase in catechol pathway